MGNENTSFTEGVFFAGNGRPPGDAVRRTGTRSRIPHVLSRPAYLLVCAAAIPFGIVVSFTLIAVVAIGRADSAAIPDVLRAIAALAGVLLRHPAE